MTRINVQATLAFDLPDGSDPSRYGTALAEEIAQLTVRWHARPSLIIGSEFTPVRHDGDRPPLEITASMHKLVVDALRGDGLPREFAALCALAQHLGIAGGRLGVPRLRVLP